ncbi:chromogranin-A isoform X1 [Sorex araneus]|uniref:chromogranin-A isoform X1 n=1 Tax=Sorex araneus TaxID=42254 RepID=UPI00243357BE|nr:chromogranin-A isoform X1 [Sorex araneus]
MRSTALLALLLCAGQVIALPVNSPMNKGDTEVMKCIVEVISDTLSKPSPVPVSQECSETLRGDERILSILRHQNLLKELQDLALQGAKERARQQKKHSSGEDELEGQSDQAPPKGGTAAAPPEEAAEKRETSEEVEAEGGRPRASSPEPTQASRDPDGQAPGQGETPHTHPPASQPDPVDTEPQAEGHGEDHAQGPASTEQEEEAAEEAGAKAQPEEEDPTSALSATPSLGSKGGPEAPAVDGARRKEAAEARPPRRKAAREHGRPQKEQQEEEEEEEEDGGQRPGPWADAKRWSNMDRLAEELAQPDRSMQLALRTPASEPRARGPARGWRPSSSQEDSLEAGLALRGRGFPEEKKEEEGSANRRAEDQELESLSAIEAELEKVAHELEALRRG